ncbi:MAG: trypsin-like peptidase domain-containing protein, partial [Planctomycetaceae bacterium]
MCTLPLLLLSAALGANPPAGPPTAAPPARPNNPVPNNAVLNFTAKWCGPCREMSPVVSKLQRAGLPIQKIDLDEQQPLARRFGITSIPAFVLVIDGQVVRKLTGAQSEETLRGLCAQVPAPAARAAEPSNLPTGPPISGVTRTADAPRGAAAPVSQGRGQSPAPPKAAVTRDPFQATVRLRVKDASGEDVGTGTVLACLDDTAYVLTCGHLFKHWNDATSQVVVELFNTAAGQAIPGRKLAANLDADVAIVSLPISQSLPTCPLAPRGTRPTKGTNLLSVGCNGGKPPTVERHQVVALNRYRGPDNLECTGIPVRGRSGGGLFNPAGEVLGVCMAEDPNYKDGMYAGLEPIYELLIANRLTSLLPVSEAAPPADAIAQTFPQDNTPLRVPPTGPLPGRLPPDDLPTAPDEDALGDPSTADREPSGPLARATGAELGNGADLDAGSDSELSLPDDTPPATRGGLPPRARRASANLATAAPAAANDAALQQILRKALQQASPNDLVVVLPGGDSPLGRVMVIHDADAQLVESLSGPGEMS